MKSLLAVTRMDDAAEAASDLLGQLADSFPLRDKSAAILFAEPGYDLAELVGLLKMGMPETSLIGCTAGAQMSNQGYHKLSATLILITGNKCDFTPLYIASLADEDMEEARATLEASRRALGSALSLVLGFSAGPAGCILQQEVERLSAICDGVPLIGGVASSYVDQAEAAVFIDDQVYLSGVVAFLLGGDIRPKLVSENLPNTRLPKHRVTKSNGAVAETIDDMPVGDFLAEYGVDPDSIADLFYSPFSVELPDADDPIASPISRAICQVDPDTGAATFTGDIPEGSMVSLQPVQAEDIVATAANAAVRLKEKMAEEVDYQYSLVLGFSCLGRHVVLTPDYENEAVVLNQTLGDQLTFGGYYTFGEYCPVTTVSGASKNRLHNVSLVLCAI